MLHFANEEIEWLGRIALTSEKVRTREHFFSWTQGPVQTLLPHEIVICGFLEQTGGYRVERFTASRYFKQEHLDAAVHPQGLISEMLARWQTEGRPVLIGREYVRGPSRLNGDDERLRRLELRNLATHGLRWMDGSVSSHVSFARIMCPLDSRLANIVEILVPLVSLTLARVLSIEATTNQPECMLSERELEILDNIRNGFTNVEIGVRLGISPLTVKNHVGNIIRKLNVRSRGHAVAKALSAGVLRNQVKRARDRTPGDAEPGAGN